MSLIKELWHDFWGNPWLPKFSIPLIIINVLGSIYGFYWYHGQLANTSWMYLIFVPDSPLSTTLFTLALIFYLMRWFNKTFMTLAMAVSIKYGIWAVLLISHFWLNGGPVNLIEIMLFFSHLGMVAEGLIYLRTIRWGSFTVYSILGWMIVNDFMDYVVGLHPYLFMQQQLVFAMLCAIGLTICISLGLFLGRKSVFVEKSYQFPKF